ncbi:MAG: sialate O-acetylesterase [Candidatus Binatia bacterium]
MNVSIAGQEHATIADAFGRWQVELDPLAAGTNYSLTVVGDARIDVENVRVGEVWICGGQSNMVLGFPTSGQLGAHPDVHTFAMDGWDDLPSSSCWEFGIRLSDAYGVPIGLLNNAVSGTKIRAWQGPAVYQDSDPAVALIVATYDQVGRLYADRVASLQPYAIRGVAWWQGESDVRQATEHVHMLPAMIRSWRAGWKREDLPFLIVQLPTGKGLIFGNRARRLPRRVDYDHRTPRMRQAFHQTTLSLDHVPMLITSDLPGGVHPAERNRWMYGERMALLARAEVYGEPLTNYSGPVAIGATAEAGGRVRVGFRASTADGLQAGGDSPLQGFAIRGESGKWVWAQSAIQGDEVVVWSPDVEAPVAVRFAYGRSTRWANLYNGAGLLAAPFEQAVLPFAAADGPLAAEDGPPLT